MADAIDKFLAMSDEDLLKETGFGKKLQSFKDNLAEAAKLEGDARKEVAKRLDDMFTPHPYVEDLKYTIESAQRKALKKTTPASVLEDCGCCDVATPC